MLILENVSKQFDNQLALNEVNLTIPTNSIFGLLGPNGAGKTTIIRLLCGILGLDKGRILYNNNPLSSSNKPIIGYLPEERGLYKKMTIKEQLLFFAQLQGVSKGKAFENIQFWTQKLEISDRIHSKIETLSKGLQQKVQFIATVVHNPDIIILDEPFTGFDPINAQLIKDQIYFLRNEGKTFIVSTHRMESVEELCDNIVLINKGNILLQGNINQIRKDRSEGIYIIKGFGKIEHLNSAKILNKQVLQNQTKLELKVDNINSLLLELIDIGFKVSSLEEYLPSMEEIFIQKIKSDVR